MRTEPIYSKCGECGSHKGVHSDSRIICDHCQTTLPEKAEYLSTTTFSHKSNTQTKDLDFCSWKCVLAKLPSIDSDYFVSLPYLHYDIDGPTSAQAFFEAIKEAK